MQIKASLLFLLVPFIALAQDEEKNIVIRNARETYEFVKGDKTNPVKVKQKLSATYFCNDFRTSIPVAAFYNDQVELNDVDVRVDGDRIKGFQPRHDYYSSDGIFYSDARICYFSLPLEKKGSTSDVVFEKTVLDPRYFTSIYFSEPFAIQQKEVRLIVPKWMKAEIREFNFKGFAIEKRREDKGDEEVFIYTIQNLPGSKSERNAPGPSYVSPHLLVLSKYAEPGGNRIGYFNSLDDQYKWYHGLVSNIGNDAAVVKAKAEEITKNVSGDMEKVKTIFQWIQDNVRYIAFEDGLAGFIPAKAQDVIRKKYGDCKGMGNLMAEMLKAIGLDGRKCWLGTNHIAYDYSTPSLSVDNHMIAAWIYKGQTYFLDPTEKYIGFGETAERIQGRQVLIENGDTYLLQRIPVAGSRQNTSTEKRTLSINGNDLVGKVVQTWKGESKEWMLSGLNDVKLDRQEDALKRFLSEGNSNYQISNLKIVNLNNYNEDLRIEYDLLFKDAVSSFDKEIYIDIDNRKDYSGFRFDTSKRRLPYLFPFKNHVVFETELVLPPDAKPSALPAALLVENGSYGMWGQWKLEGGKIVYRREIELKNTLVATEAFGTWNGSVEKLTNFYNNQLVIIK